MTQMIKNVAIAGAAGNAGTPILKALLESNNFNITILTRSPPPYTFPPNTQVKQVDYTSLPSLTAALEGQDALINATYIGDAAAQTNLIDAASAAGIKRYLPSEFGINTASPSIASLPVFAYAAAALTHLHEICARSEMTYSVLHNGGFLDWCFEMAFLGIDVKGRKATLYDGGNTIVPYTTREWVGKAVVGILLAPEKTSNRSVFVANTYMSQKKLLALAQEVTGEADTWTVEEKDTDAMLASSYEKLESGDMAVLEDAMLDFVRVAVVKFEHGWDGDDNALLGIPKFGEGEVKKVVGQYV